MDIRKWLAEAEADQADPRGAPTAKHHAAASAEPTKRLEQRARVSRPKHTKDRRILESRGLSNSPRLPKKRRRECISSTNLWDESPPNGPNGDQVGPTRCGGSNTRDDRQSGLWSSSVATDGSSEPPTPSSERTSPLRSRPATPEPRYERRARHKTRDDRYILQNEQPGKKRRRTDGAGRQRKARKSVARRGKTSEAIVQNFSASNVAQDRLTVGYFLLEWVVGAKETSFINLVTYVHCCFRIDSAS